MIVVLFASLAVLVGLAVALVLARGNVSVHMAPATASMSGGLPRDELTSADIDAVRFDTVVRGYRMDQVDDVLDRVRAELARRDEELRELRSRAPAGPLQTAPGDHRRSRQGRVSALPSRILDDDDELGESPRDDWDPPVRGFSRPGDSSAQAETSGRSPETDR